MEKLIDSFAKKSGLSIEQASNFIAVFVQIMEDELTEKDAIHIDGLRVYKKIANTKNTTPPKPQKLSTDN